MEDYRALVPPCRFRNWKRKSPNSPGQVGVLRALAQLQVRLEPRGSTRKGARSACAARLAADRRSDGTRGAELLEGARPHHVESIVRYYRRAQQAEQLSREAHQQAERSVTYWYDEDGSLVLRARLPAPGGALRAWRVGAVPTETARR